MIQVTYDRAAFTAQFNAVLARAQNQEGMLMVVGRSLANELKSWFRKKDRSEPNKLSPRREHFWLQVAGSVQSPRVSGDKVSVTISDPRIAQKVFGGAIVAKRAGALTIPMSEQAYGRTAATFERETGLKLFLLKKRTGDPARGQIGPSNLERAVLAAKVNGKIEVEYLLVKRVVQEPDEDALPPESEMERIAIERGQKFVQREEKNNQ